MQGWKNGPTLLPTSARLHSGHGNPLTTTPDANTRLAGRPLPRQDLGEVRQYTVGFYDPFIKGAFGAVKIGLNSPTTSGFASKAYGGAPKTTATL